MPSRLAVRSVRRSGPVPFTSEWQRSPGTPPSRPALILPPWVPGERALSAVLVLLLTFTIALATADGRTQRPAAPPTPDHPAVGGGVDFLSAPDPPALAAELATATPRATAVPAESPTPTFVPAPALGTPQAPDPAPDGALLPSHRIVSFYGHPHDANMGVLGEHSIDDLYQLLLAEAANYDAADPSRPVIPAFELIATVAQRVPGDDGTYILDTDKETLTEYIDFAAEHDMLVFLDLQIGRGTVAADLEKVRPLLARPNVHLALDPEFAIGEGEIPGEQIGSLGADSITYAQEQLAAIAAENNLPPKILVVHQFREDMIAGKEHLQPVPGVQLVIDADGYGEPVLKTDVYNYLVRDQPVQFGGVKLFYKQDVPLMSPADVLALKPSPDMVIYQ